MFNNDNLTCAYLLQYLSRAEQDGFGLMALLRLIGRLTQDGVPDAVPEGVAFYGACMTETGTAGDT